MIRVNGESIKKIILMGGKRWSSADFSHKLVSTVNTEDHARAHDPQCFLTFWYVLKQYVTYQLMKSISPKI